MMQFLKRQSSMGFKYKICYESQIEKDTHNPNKIKYKTIYDMVYNYMYFQYLMS